MDLPEALGPERLRAYPVVIIIVAAVVWAGWLMAVRDGLDLVGKPAGADYIALHAAGTLVLEGRAADVYDLDRLERRVLEILPPTDAVLPIHYPPPALLAFSVTSRLPYGMGLAAWTFGSLAAIAAMLALLRSGPLAWRWGFAYPGTLLVLFNGQTTAWIAASVCGGLALVARQPVLGGLLIGLSVAKPNYLVLPLVALAVGAQWRALAAAVLSALALCGLSLVALGPAPWVAWFGHLPELGVLMASGVLPIEKMPTVAASATMWRIPVAVASAAQALATLGALGSVALAARRGDPDRLVVVVAFAAFLFTPFAFDYDLVFAWGGLYGLSLRSDGTRPSWVLLAAGFILPIVLPGLSTIYLPLAPLLLGVLLFYGLSRPVDPSRTG